VSTPGSPLNFSVIIATLNRTDDLRKCIDSLACQRTLPAELIVVDASENDATETLCRSVQVPFKVAYTRSEPGITRQRNIGIGMATAGQLICFCDDDVVLEPECLSAVQRAFAAHQADNLGGLMGRIVNGGGRPGWRDRLLKRIFFLSDCGPGRVKLSGLPSIATGDEPRFVQSLTGCFMVYPREVFRDFGFDEKLSRYCYMEDVDFSWRVGRTYRLLYEPAARLQHFPTTYRTAGSGQLRRMFIRNHRYLFHKNMPQTLRHRYAFWMSICGALFYNSILLHDLPACQGILQGLRDPLPC
jgi:GT2 family glycosyltransferase